MTACLSGPHCADKLDGQPRDTTTALCDGCLRQAAERIDRLPEQHLRLHAVLGDRHAGIDTNIRRVKPGSTVPLNLHVDTLLGDIAHMTTLAAEVICDQWRLRAYPHHHDAQRQVGECCAVIGMNLDRLVALAELDVMFWVKSGVAHGVTVTTGPLIIVELGRLSSLAHFTLGLTRHRDYRDLPCTRCGKTEVGRWAGRDEFDCRYCGSRFPEDDLRRQDRILLALCQRGLVKA